MKNGADRKCTRETKEGEISLSSASAAAVITSLVFVLPRTTFFLTPRGSGKSPSSLLRCYTGGSKVAFVAILSQQSCLPILTMPLWYLHCTWEQIIKKSFWICHISISTDKPGSWKWNCFTMTMLEKENSPNCKVTKYPVWVRKTAQVLDVEKRLSNTSISFSLKYE